MRRGIKCGLAQSPSRIIVWPVSRTTNLLPLTNFTHHLPDLHAPQDKHRILYYTFQPNQWTQVRPRMSCPATAAARKPRRGRSYRPVPRSQSPGTRAYMWGRRGDGRRQLPERTAPEVEMAASGPVLAIWGPWAKTSIEAPLYTERDL
jgi:hypothetical protein